MIIVDLHDPKRVNRTPDDVKVLLSSGNFTQDDFVISKVELRLYNERTDEKRLLESEMYTSSFMKH